MNKWLILSMALSLACINQKGNAVEYELPDLDGKLQSFDQYLGKWVIANYWATWCTTCRHEITDLLDLHKNGKQQIAVVGINFENIANKKLKQFITEQGITYPILRSAPIPITALGKVPALPTTYIIDPQGKIVAAEVGLVTRKNMEDYIEEKNAFNLLVDVVPDKPITHLKEQAHIIVRSK